VIELRARRPGSKSLQLIPVPRAFRGTHAFAKTSGRSRLALAAIAERSVTGTFGVVLETPRIVAGVGGDDGCSGSRRWP